MSDDVVTAKLVQITLSVTAWNEVLKHLAYAEDVARQEVLQYQVRGMPSSSVHYQKKADDIQTRITAIQEAVIMSGNA